MVNILELDPQGELRIPAEVLQQLAAAHQFQVEIHEDMLILRPVNSQPFWQVATPKERASRWQDWANQPRPPSPALTDQALRRDSIYDA